MSTRCSGHLGPGPRACGVDQLSRMIRAHVRWPACSTSSPGPIVLGSDGTRGRPVVPATQPSSQGSRAQLSLPSPSCFGPSAKGVDQLFRVTQTRVRGPAGSAGCSKALLGLKGSMGLGEK